MLDFLRTRKGRWILVICLWFPATILMAFQGMLDRKAMGKPIAFADALRWPLVEYTFWLVLVPLLFDAGRRFSFRSADKLRIIATLVSLNAAVVLLHASYRAQLHDFVYPKAIYPAMLYLPGGTMLWFYVVGNFLADVWMFWTVIGAVAMVEYYERYRDRERELVHAQLQALRGQLQPHFLFNTLNSISTLMHEDLDAADNMMAALASLLRRTLRQDGAHEVTLREEMEILGLYLDIQRMRFEDRLHIRVDVKPETLDALVPTFILQPLVENAVRHGISQRPGAGTIEVCAEREHERLKLRVIDDGPGPRGDRGSPEGVGLANTRARITRHYGESAHFVLRDLPNGGALAELVLPFRRVPAAIT